MALSNNTIKYIKSLHLRKFRQKYNNFIVEGDKISREILQQTKFEVEMLYALPEWLAANQDLLIGKEKHIQEISEGALSKISALRTPNQVLVVLKQHTARVEERVLRSNFSLYLDNIQDPGNMGTMLRIADWFGIPYVFCSQNCVERWSPKVIQASMGAFLRVESPAVALTELIQKVPDLPIYGATLNGSNIFQTTFAAAGIIVIGNESKGISPEIGALVRQQIAIPSGPGGAAESLNAAVATGIIVAVIKNLPSKG